MKNAISIAKHKLLNQENRDIIVSFFIKAISFIVNIYSLRIYNAYFKDNIILGLWLTIISVINWIGFFDFGIGNGLRNTLTKAIAMDDIPKIRESIASSYLIISLLSFSLLLIGVPLCMLVNWNYFFSIDASVISPKYLSQLMIVLFSGTVLHLLLKNIVFILYASIKNIEAAIINFLCNFLILILIPITLMLGIEGSPLKLTFLYVFAFNFPLLIATIVVFSGRYKYAIPKINYVKWKTTRAIFRLGNIFFFLQLSLLVINSTNDMLISYLFGNTYVVDYNAYMKIASAISGAFLVITNPIWSHIAFYDAQGDNVKVHELSKMIIVIALIACLGCLALSVFYKPIFSFFYGSLQIQISSWHTILMAIYGCSLILQGAVACIANGLNRLRVQLVVYIIGAIVKIPVTIAARLLLSDWSIVIIVNIMIIIIYIISQSYSLWKCNRSEL